MSRGLPRTTIELGELPHIDWGILRGEERFLFRRMADQDRAILAIGSIGSGTAPRFRPHGAVEDWTCVALDYEWKDDLFSSAVDGSEHITWWTPRWVVEWRGRSVRLHVVVGEEAEVRDWAARAFNGSPPATDDGPFIAWKEHTTKADHVERVERLMAHIQRGDIYEVNYCTTRTAHCPQFDPFHAFAILLARSQAPFAAFHGHGEKYALCASPERYLAFHGRRVVGEPMKGTRPRHPDPEQDHALALELAADPKERSENVMALDVMRHDLSRIAQSRSVKVEELCAVRSYPRVHQLVSTVSAVMRDDTSPLDVLRATFPMASMTGAPKLRAMQLIEQVEDAPRGPFSGSFGFFAPDGTGDFNVVIRTVLFNARTGSLSLSTGSAITAQCDSEREFDECQVKARSVIDALRHA